MSQSRAHHIAFLGFVAWVMSAAVSRGFAVLAAAVST
jgi:hypothetical protein